MLPGVLWRSQFCLLMCQKGLWVKKLFHVRFAHKLDWNIAQTKAQWQVWRCDLLRALAFCHINSTLNKTLAKRKRSINRLLTYKPCKHDHQSDFQPFLEISEMEFHWGMRDYFRLSVPGPVVGWHDKRPASEAVSYTQTERHCCCHEP